MERRNPNSTPPSTPPPNIPPEMPKLEKRPESELRLNEWKTLLNESFCLGENHQDVAAKKFLIENMQNFQCAGYEVLFMEHLTQEEHQHLINGYFQENCLAKDMPKDLESYLRRQDKGHSFLGDPDKQYNFVEIVRSAKKAGIRIVCLEKNVADYEVKNKEGPNRMKSLNEHTVKLVRKENPDLKYIAFVGNAHLNEMHGIAGICEVLKVQDIAVFDAPENSSESFFTSEKKVAHSFGGKLIKSSIILTLNPVRKLNFDENLPDKINKVTLGEPLGKYKFEAPPPRESPNSPTAKKAKVEVEVENLKW
ncbi:MAG: hypothetical protein ACJAS6_000552 [Rickettsiales bacterium]|jgi:hypothetical protein